MSRFNQEQINDAINEFITDSDKLQITINETDHSTVLKLKDANEPIQNTGDANPATE